MDPVLAWRLATEAISAVTVFAMGAFMYRYVTTLNVMKKDIEADGSTLVAPPKTETIMYHSFFATYLTLNMVGTLQRIHQHAPATWALWPTPFVLVGLLFFLQRFYFKYTAILRSHQ